jgi:molybdopterin molybdotransferase
VADSVLPAGGRLLEVGEAQAIVAQHSRPLPPETTPLGTTAVGLVLAEDVASDLDMPPFDKSMMDGYAVRRADLAEGRAVLTVIEEIGAGQTPQKSLVPGQATRIMTGAPVPAGADAVVMVERTRLLEDGRVAIEDRPPEAGQHILPQGREMRRGEVVLHAGSLLRAAELGLLASVGRSSVRAHPAPQVAILPTGDELVEPGMPVGPGAIRNSNAPMLVAQVFRTGGVAQYLGIARDNLESLRPLVARGLEADVLVLSGGVSAGKRDLVPEVLAEAGVEPHFHKVKMKPGKPVFFGTRARQDRPPTLVFGLPGNPVSALVCFELFVHPALARMAGHSRPEPVVVSAALLEDFAYSTDRPTYHPARVEPSPQGWCFHPVPWFGSADLRGLTQANAFALFPPGQHRHRAGQRFEVIPLD